MNEASPAAANNVSAERDASPRTSTAPSDDSIDQRRMDGGTTGFGNARDSKGDSTVPGKRPFPRDVLPVILGAPSLFPAGTRRLCAWTPPGEQPHEIPAGTRKDSDYCSKKHRQQAWRFKARIGRPVIEEAGRAMTFGFGDPPYPGKAFYYPEKTEVDHLLLVQRMEREFRDGWALSTDADNVFLVGDILRDAGVPRSETRLCAWFRPTRWVKSTKALGGWEPLFVVRGRPLEVPDKGATGVVDTLLDLDAATGPRPGTRATRRESTRAIGRAEQLENPSPVDREGRVAGVLENGKAAKFGGGLREDAYLDRGRYRAFPGALIGMKPPGFAEWLFQQLGARPGDTFVDMFPGSGAVTYAWEKFSGKASPATSGATR